MNIVKVMGGLGNQMFQYAFARELQHIGKSVKVDISYYNDIPKGDTHRVSAHARLAGDLSVASSDEIEYYVQKDAASVWKFIKKVDKTRRFVPIFYEDDRVYNSVVLKRDTGYYIGYWQNIQYFSGVADALKCDYIQACAQLNEKSKRILERINACQCAISVHVRGGDYYNATNRDIFGGICDAAYYRKAIRLCKERFEGCHFFVFTNDRQLAYKILPSGEEYEMIDGGDSEGYMDIFLMSRCRHNIIANSSFSWWGAYLNKNEERRVLAPSEWSHTGGYAGIYCDEWIRIG